MSPVFYLNMKKLICLFTIAFLISGCHIQSRKMIGKFSNGRTKSEVFYPDKDDTTSCTIKIYYNTGELYELATMYHGMYVGIKTVYHKNGKPLQTDSLTEPCDTTITCDGILTRYYDNGKISGRYEIHGHQINGLARQFTRSGVLAKEYELINDTVKNGIYKEYHDSGIRAFEGHFKMDTLVGHCYFFDEKGDSLKSYNNDNGVIALPYKKWLSDKRSLEGNYSKDNKTVIWIWYDKDGRILKRKINGINKPYIEIPE